MAVLSRFRFRARTSWHSSISIATYSEFGLIVAVVVVDRDVLDQRRTSAIAVAVALSFALAAPLNTARFTVYGRLSPLLGRLERQPVQHHDALIDPIDAQIIVFGMGRVGAGAYDELVRRRGDVVMGVDRIAAVASENCAAGRRVVQRRRTRRRVLGPALPRSPNRAATSSTSNPPPPKSPDGPTAGTARRVAQLGVNITMFRNLTAGQQRPPRAQVAWRACETTLLHGFGVPAMAGSIGASNARRSPRIPVEARNRRGTTHGLVVVPDGRAVEVSDARGLVASTDRSGRVLETSHPPAFYLPPDSMVSGQLVRVPGSSHCEWKGAAEYVAVVGTTEPVGWRYPDPYREFVEHAGWISFCPGRVRCTVDGEVMRPQAGGFYGGWITDDIVGPFKGDPGTSGW